MGNWWTWMACHVAVRNCQSIAKRRIFQCSDDKTNSLGYITISLVGIQKRKKHVVNRKKIPVYKIAFDHWKESIKVFRIFCYICCVLDNLITYTVLWILYAQWAKTWENSTQGKKYKNSLQLWGNYSTSSIIFPKWHSFSDLSPLYCCTALYMDFWWGLWITG